MPASAAKIRGHSEVGHVEAPSTDVPWGRTTEDGVEMQLGVQSVDLFSSQSLMEEDTGITRVSIGLVIPLVYAELEVIKNAFGIPDASLTGDLSAGTPTQEVLALAPGDIGSQERALYSLGVGPVSTRRIDVPRAKVTDLGNLKQSKTGWMTPQATWRALAPASGPVLTITDDV